MWNDLVDAGQHQVGKGRKRGKATEIATPIGVAARGKSTAARRTKELLQKIGRVVCGFV